MFNKYNVMIKHNLDLILLEILGLWKRKVYFIVFQLVGGIEVETNINFNWNFYTLACNPSW